MNVDLCSSSNSAVIKLLSFTQDNVKPLKNAASWSSLAAGSSTTSIKKPNAMQSFELFKKQAKEKEERVCYNLKKFILKRKRMGRKDQL